MLKKFFLTTLLLAVFITCGCGTKSDQVEAAQNVKENVKGDLKISMFDIGHGDAILIRTGEQTILIDTAKLDRNDEFVRELEKFSVTKIDKLILTHPHIDHIGGTGLLINPSKTALAKYPYLENVSVSEVYDNGVAYTTKTYLNYLKATKAKKLPYRNLKAGDTLDFGNGVKFEVLSPTAEFVETVNSAQYPEGDRAYNKNNGSIVGKLTYKKFSMMFTGDCEKESEAKILANYDAKFLKCDVLKAGHHGLSTSSSKEFVDTINPSCVLISAPNQVKDNIAYGAPRLKVLKNYLTAGVDKENIFCTRFNSSITITSDGKNFSVEPENKEDWVDKWMAHLKSRQKK